MPGLDVSFVVLDPMLADVFDVTRRAVAINSKGRQDFTETTTTDLVGVVTQQDPSDLMRRDDGQMVPRSIFVASNFAFRAASEGFQPDIITWPAASVGGGAQYTITQVYPYGRYGAGIYECVATIMQATNPPT